MNSASILKYRLLCFLAPALFFSFTAMAKPAGSGKAEAGGILKDLNIAPFGILKTWYKIADPIGKTISYKDFNSSAAADTSDIGILWWEARDIQKIEVVYDAKPADGPSWRGFYSILAAVVARDTPKDAY